MEETTPHCDCGLIVGPWANGGAPLAGGRGMVTDRFIQSTLRSLSARFLPSWRTGEIEEAGVKGFSRSGRPYARHARDNRLPSFPGNGTGRRQRSRQSVRPRRRSFHPQTSPTNRLSMPCVCRNRPDTTLLSSTYLSQGAVRSRTQDAWGRTAPPVNALTFAPHRGNPGVGPRTQFPAFGSPAQGVLGLGSQTSP